MEPSEVVLSPVSEEAPQIDRHHLHVGNLSERAALQEGEERPSHPVDTKDVDGQALFEVIPRAKKTSQPCPYPHDHRHLHGLHPVAGVLADAGIVDQDVQPLAPELGLDLGSGALDGRLVGHVEPHDRNPSRRGSSHLLQGRGIAPRGGKDLADLGGGAGGEFAHEGEAEAPGGASDENRSHCGVPSLCGGGCTLEWQMDTDTGPDFKPRCWPAPGSNVPTRLGMRTKKCLVGKQPPHPGTKAVARMTTAIDNPSSSMTIHLRGGTGSICGPTPDGSWLTLLPWVSPHPGPMGRSSGGFTPRPQPPFPKQP